MTTKKQNIKMQLQDAQARWVQGENDNQWLICTPEGEELGFLPERLSDKEVMTTLRLMRKYEKEGFLMGVEEGLRRGSNATNFVKESLTAQINDLAAKNNYLADQLERKITGD